MYAVYLVSLIHLLDNTAVSDGIQLLYCTSLYKVGGEGIGVIKKAEEMYKNTLK